MGSLHSISLYIHQLFCPNPSLTSVSKLSKHNMHCPFIRLYLVYGYIFHSSLTASSADDRCQNVPPASNGYLPEYVQHVSTEIHSKLASQKKNSNKKMVGHFLVGCKFLDVMLALNLMLHLRTQFLNSSNSILYSLSMVVNKISLLSKAL